MARPHKQGLDYFPFDVDFFDDYKIIDLLNEYGPLGVSIYQAVVCQVYRNGYYLDIPLNMLASQIMRVVGNRWIKNKNLVLQVIHYCAEIGLFDNALLQQNVITSVGIQKRYSEVTVRNKIDKSQYWLIEKNNCQSAEVNVAKTPVSVAKTPVSVAKTPVSVAKTPQSKGNESKVNIELLHNSAPCADKSAPDAGNECNDNSNDIFIKLPLNDKSLYSVSVRDVEHYKELYPAVNVEQELRSMLGWLESEPAKRKTKKGIKGFITRWLTKRQDQGGTRYVNQGYVANNGSGKQVSAAKETSRDYYKGEQVF